MAASPKTSDYLIALGSNRRHVRFGSPERVLRAATGALERHGIWVDILSPIAASAPLGPSRRRYANAVALVCTDLDPDALLVRLKAIERSFGRRPGGQRWSARVLDLDIVLWAGGTWTSPGLVVPHVAFRERRFVLAPAARIAPNWRDPITGLTLRHLLARRIRPIASRSGP